MIALWTIAVINDGEKYSNLSVGIKDVFDDVIHCLEPPHRKETDIIPQ